MISRRRTFDDIQRIRRRSSLVLFAFLAGFYLIGCALLWGCVRVLFILFAGRLRPGGWSLTGELAVLLSVALAAALIHWLAAAAGGAGRILESLGAGPPDPRDRYHRVFLDVVEELKLASGLERIEAVVLPTVAMNAFTVTDLKGRSFIGVTEGLLSGLSRRQIQAVVAHEVAHIREGDNLLVTMACSLFGVFAQMLAGLRSAGDEDGRADLLLPVVWLLTLGAYLINVLISRQREHLADATAVELTRDPVALAEALYGIGRRWRGEGFVREELAPIFVVNPAAGGLGDSEGLLADLFSTHPPLRKRIGILLGMAHVGWGVLLRRDPEAPPGVTASAGMTDSEAAKETGAPVAPPGAAESSAGDAPSCPACHIPLGELEYEGIIVRRCPSCRGFLLAKGQDLRILMRREEVFDEDIHAAAREFVSRNLLRPRRGSGTATCRCPVCRRPMRRQPYGYQYFVEVDRCLSCGLTWFDKDELEILQILVEKACRDRGEKGVLNK